MRKILPTPQEMIAHMDLYVEGQSVAKRVLAKAVYFHYLNLARAEQGKPKIAAEHCLVIGPTGSGKTLLIKTLGAFLDVPVLFCNAASLSAEGYVGESVSDLMCRLQSFCGNDKFKMSRAILFLDEVDKLASREQGTVRSEMVQQELLAVLDGNKLGRMEKSSNKTFAYEVDTSKLLIVGSGAFAGIEKIAESRLGKFGIGFKSEQASQASPSGNVFDEVIAEDIVKYGFLPEFVARFTNVIPLTKLDKEQYLAILNSSYQSPFSNVEELFDLHGIKLKISPEARNLLATSAAKADEGARGLRRMAADVAKNVDWRLGELSSTGCSEILVRVDNDLANFELDFTYGVRSSADEAEKLRRSVFEFSAPQPTKTEDSPGASAGKSEEAPLPRVKLPPGISDTRDWSEERLTSHLEHLKADHLDWNSTTGSAHKWWLAFENDNRKKLTLVVRLAEELKVRKATIVEFFMAYVYSNTDNIQANLAYLEYARVKNELRKSGAQIAKATLGDHTDEKSSKADLRDCVNYADASADGRFLYDCIEEAVNGRADPMKRFGSEMKKRTGCSLDRLFTMAALSQLYDPTALFHFYDYVDLRCNELRLKSAQGWYREFYVLGGLSQCSEASADKVAVHAGLLEGARNSLLRTLEANHTGIASNYAHKTTGSSHSGKDSWPQNAPLDSVLDTIIDAIAKYPGSLGEWRAEFRKLIIDFLLPSLVAECLAAGDKGLLKKAFDRLSKPVDMGTSEEVWARTLHSVLRHHPTIDSSHLSFIEEAYPSLLQAA